MISSGTYFAAASEMHKKIEMIMIPDNIYGNFFFITPSPLRKFTP
jgi:hypothetical protein